MYGITNKVRLCERSEPQSERIRLDCVSEANHNLNRLLDKPGGGLELTIKHKWQN